MNTKKLSFLNTDVSFDMKDGKVVGDVYTNPKGNPNKVKSDVHLMYVIHGLLFNDLATLSQLPKTNTGFKICDSIWYPKGEGIVSGHTELGDEISYSSLFKGKSMFTNTVISDPNILKTKRVDRPVKRLIISDKKGIEFIQQQEDFLTLSRNPKILFSKKDNKLYYLTNRHSGVIYESKVVTLPDALEKGKSDLYKFLENEVYHFLLNILVELIWDTHLNNSVHTIYYNRYSLLIYNDNGRITITVDGKLLISYFNPKYNLNQVLRFMAYGVGQSLRLLNRSHNTREIKSIIENQICEFFEYKYGVLK